MLEKLQGIENRDEELTRLMGESAEDYQVMVE